MNKKDEMIIMCTVEFQISDFLLMEFDLKVMLNLKSSDLWLRPLHYLFLFTQYVCTNLLINVKRKKIKVGIKYITTLIT